MVGQAGPVRSESARRPQKAVASQRQPTTINEVFPQDRGHSGVPTWDAYSTRTSSSSTTTADRDGAA